MRSISDLNDMLVFATVVEQGSFTLAAEVLNTPKSNISRKLTRLEQNLGVRLLERSTRKQRLTEIGQQYYSYCQRIKEEIKAADTAVETLLARPQGLLRLCASVSVGQSLLAPQLGEFCRHYPDVELDITLTNRRVDVIEEGYDLVIRVGDLPDSGLVAKKLCHLTLHLYASPDYQIKNIHSPDDLSDYSLLLMNAKQGKRERKACWELSSKTETRQLAFSPAVRCDDFSTLKQLSIQGVGITALPDYMTEESIQSGQLIRVLPEWSFPPVDLYAIYPSHRGATPKVRAMVDFLANVYSVQACAPGMPK